MTDAVVVLVDAVVGSVHVPVGESGASTISLQHDKGQLAERIGPILAGSSPADSALQLGRQRRSVIVVDLVEHKQEWMRDQMAHRWLGFGRDTVERWFHAAGASSIDYDLTGSFAGERLARNGNRPLSAADLVAHGIERLAADHDIGPTQRATLLLAFGYAGDGSIALNADLAFENATGQVLGEAENVFSLSASGPAGKREFYMALTFEVPFLRPGEYTAIFTVHDQNSAKSGTFEVPFDIALPVAQ